MTSQDPNRQQPDSVWRNRFILMNLAGIAGTAVALLGLAIWYSDLLVEGGSMAIGLPMALIGVVASFIAPKLLARRWRTPPGS
jgi:pilus assembly protein TadC